MKNIIIAGIPRSGKTTLAKKLFFELPNYNLIQQDIILGVYNHIYSKYLAKRTKKDENTEEIIIDIPFIEKIKREITKNIYNELINDDKNIGIIFECYDFNLKYLKKREKAGDIVIILGCNELTLNEFFNNIRNFDTPDDRTYYLSNYKLQYYLEDYMIQTKKDKAKCKELGLTYIDTSINRNEKFDEIVTIIKEKLKED